MDGRQNVASLAVGWGAFLGNLVFTHINIILSVLCGIAALSASVYSIVISRRKLQHMRAHDEALCRRCREGADIECPYPTKERPENCPLRNQP